MSFVCVTKHISVLLTDDMAVRHAVRRLHFVPVGSLGIVVLAFKRKEIALQEAERLHRRLARCEQSFCYTCNR